MYRACARRLYDGGAALHDPRVPLFSLPEPGAPSLVVSEAMGQLWEEVRHRLDAADDEALGNVHVGKKEYEQGWAHTNDGQDCVNLTLELFDDELQLNLVGWQQVQSDALKKWLQTVRGEDAVNALDGYEVVAYKRVAHKGQWQGAKGFELAACSAPDFNGNWLFQQMAALRSKKEEKPAFHLRRAWPRAEAEGLGEELPPAIAAEVRRLMPLLRDIWASGFA